MGEEGCRGPPRHSPRSCVYMIDDDEHVNLFRIGIELWLVFTMNVFKRWLHARDLRRMGWLDKI